MNTGDFGTEISALANDGRGFDAAIVSTFITGQKPAFLIGLAR